MLTKLIRHDFKNIGKLLLPLNALILLMTLVGIILDASGVFDLENAMVLQVILVSAYTIGIIVIMVISFFYPIIHFYRNLFTKQGYLTFTLPACSWEILASKTIVGYVWYLVNMAVNIFSVWAIAGFPRVPQTAVDSWNRYVMGTVGMSFTTFWSWIMLTIALGLLYGLISAYFSISVGQLYAKHKIVASVVVYIGLYTIMQVIVLAILAAFMLSAPTQEMLINVALYSIAIFSVVFGTLFYVLSGVVLKKKVNLD